MKAFSCESVGVVAQLLCLCNLPTSHVMGSYLVVQPCHKGLEIGVRIKCCKVLLDNQIECT